MKGEAEMVADSVGGSCCTEIPERERQTQMGADTVPQHMEHHHTFSKYIGLTQLAASSLYLIKPHASTYRGE